MIIILCYYGLFRIGELTYSEHVVKAKDTHIGMNKDKMLFILHSSKTHTKGMKPQEIKITSSETESTNPSLRSLRKHFCPFDLAQKYMDMRGNYQNDTDAFFVFKDGNPVHSSHVRKVLRQALDDLDLDSKLYNTHSLRSGRAIDMLKNLGKSIEFVKVAGRWRSNVVYRYLKIF